MNLKEPNPLVSIVIPVYNGSNYVQFAIESCLKQTYSNIEIIIVNDGSNDDGKTREAILKYGSRVKYFEKSNGGVASALNLAIKQASGQYISWLSHDDVYDLNKIELQVKELKKYNDHKVIIYSDFLVINSGGQTVDYQPCPRITPEQFRVSLLMGSFLHGCSLLIPKSVFDEYGYFDESLKTTQDYKFWFQISKTYKFAQIPEYLVHSRWHADQGVNKSKSIHIRECNNLYLWAPTVFSWGELQDFGFYSKSDFYFKYAKRCKGDGFTKASRYYYLKALSTANPRDLILAGCKSIKRILVDIKKSFFSSFGVMIFILVVGCLLNLTLDEELRSIYRHNQVSNLKNKSLFEMSKIPNTDWGRQDLNSYLTLKSKISGKLIILPKETVMSEYFLENLSKVKISKQQVSFQPSKPVVCVDLRFLSIKEKINFCYNSSADIYVLNSNEDGLSIQPILVKYDN